MKNYSHIIYRIIVIVSLIAYCLQANSCANTKGAPTGGPKDTIPPVIVSLFPEMNAVNVPRKKTQINITFNEYVQIKDANKNILLSPPQNKKLQTKIKGKGVIVTFPEELDSAKTYSIYFGSAIQDNNEGNPLNNFVYSFSTGSHVDSMLLSGTVIDNVTLMPQEGISVALYESPTDSCVITTLPDAITKTDKWGYFCFRNLKEIPYAIFAFKDDNLNNKYEQDNEIIGFADTMVIPKIVMKPDLPQLGIYDIKDTLGLKSRPSEMDIYIFKERPTRQYISNKGRINAISGFVKFNAPDVIIDSFAIDNIPDINIIKEFNNTNDSLAFWINESKNLPDTLFLGIKYHKTDSLGNLVPTVENLKLAAPRVDKKKQEEEKRAKRERGEKIDRDDLLKFKLTADGSKIEQDGYLLDFDFPLRSADFDSISLKSSNPKKVITNERFIFEKDSTNIKRYIIKPVNEFKIGNEYILNIPTGVFTDINGFTNDSIENKISLPTDDKLSAITLQMQNVDARYIVELVNDKRNTVYGKYIITGDITLHFKYLKEGMYSIRITQDLNGNGILDPGSLLLRKQPEKVRMYKLDNGRDIIEIKERIDVDQIIDVKKLFN